MYVRYRIHIIKHIKKIKMEFSLKDPTKSYTIP